MSSKAEAPGQANGNGNGRLHVFLGGSCDPTTWRKDVAIPLLTKHRVSYYDPQIAGWHPGLIQQEGRAKEECIVLLFVIDGRTRAIASMLEATEMVMRGRNVVLVIENLAPGLEIEGEPVGARQREDLNRARTFLLDIATRNPHNCDVFSNVEQAVRHIAYSSQGYRARSQSTQSEQGQSAGPSSHPSPRRHLASLGTGAVAPSHLSPSPHAGRAQSPVCPFDLPAQAAAGAGAALLASALRPPSGPSSLGSGSGSGSRPGSGSSSRPGSRPSSRPGSGSTSGHGSSSSSGNSTHESGSLHDIALARSQARPRSAEVAAGSRTSTPGSQVAAGSYVPPTTTAQGTSDA